MTVTHKKAAQILQSWNLRGEALADIYHEGTGNKHENALRVGEDFILKYTANPGKLHKHICLSKSLESVGLLSKLEEMKNILA